jgi:hypothetical protein
MIVATFPNQPSLLHAAARLRHEPGAQVETYTAEEPAVAEAAADTTLSRIPLVILAAFLLGATAFFFLQTYATTLGYRMGIGGRPAFAWPSFIPNAFEMGVLSAMIAGLLAFLLANRMPRLWDPVDEAPAIRRVMRGANVLTLGGLEDKHARELLAGLAPTQIEALDA